VVKHGTTGVVWCLLKKLGRDLRGLQSSALREAVSTTLFACQAKYTAKTSEVWCNSLLCHVPLVPLVPLVERPPGLVYEALLRRPDGRPPRFL